MFVKPANSNTGFLHHIGNADAFETEFAKPLGSNAHDPSVRLRFVTLRITHLPSPSLPESAWIAPGKSLLEYQRTLHWMQIASPWPQEARCVNNTYCRFVRENEERRNVRKEFIKYFATPGLCSYSTVVKARITPSQAQEKQ